MSKKLEILKLIFLCALNISAQTGTQIYEKHFIKDKKVIFRISPADKKAYETWQKSYLKITRFEVQNSNLVNEQLIEDKLACYPETDTIKWMKLVKGDKNKAGLAYQALFQNKGDPKLNLEKRERQKKIMFDLLLLSCDFDAEIAKACGLYFIDTTINNNLNYVYKVQLHTSPTSFKELIAINVKASALSINKKINDLHGKCKNKISIIEWNANNYRAEYSGYNIERSDDSLNYKRINNAPAILLSSQFEKNKESIIYYDTMPIVNKKYYYRIKGINFFGEESEPSNIISNYNHPAINSVPLLDSIYIVKNTHVRLKWRMGNNNETHSLKNFILMRSEKENGKYTIIYDSKTKLEFVDVSPQPINFYKIGAISFKNDTIYSYSRMALIVDTIPPSSPVGLKAIVDKNGKITLLWKKNREIDMQGYKLFKANSKNEEFVQINNKFITDTVYSDKLNLNTLSKKVFYCLAASDNNFNTSANCLPIEVSRPDTIAPACPILNSVYPEFAGVKLRFVLSKSDDVTEHKILRKSEAEAKETELKLITVKDTIAFYLDTTALHQQTYSYQIKAYDEDNNFSSSRSLVIKYETGFRKKLTDLNCVVDRTKKNISLTWKYKETEIEKFVLYRAKENEPLTIIKTIEGSVMSYVDKTPNIGNTYEYRIKAVLYNGAESIISDPIKVVY